MLDGSADVPWDEVRGVAGWGAYDFEIADDLEKARDLAQRRAEGASDGPAADLARLCAALAWWQRSDHGLSGCARIVLRVVAERRTAPPADQRRAA